MSTKSLTFSAVNQQTETLVVKAGQNASYSLTGEFEATLAFQRKENNGAWVTLAETTDEEVATTALSPRDQDASYRWICTDYTEGDPLATISDVATNLVTWEAQDGSKPFQVNQDGVVATNATIALLLTVAGNLSLGTPQTSITAFATGGQTNAVALTPARTVHRVTVCATNGDSVRLPAPTSVGELHIVANDGAASLQVFGAGTDTINSVATATGVAVPAGKRAMFIAMATGAASNWIMLLGA